MQPKGHPMTLTKYWINSVKEQGDYEPMYLCADVDRVVEELTATIRDHEESERTAWDATHKAEADLARVTAELTDARWKLKKYEPDMQFHVEGK